MKLSLRILLILTLLLVAPLSVLAQDGEEATEMGAWEACPDPENLSGEIPLGVTFSLTEGAAIYGEPQSKAAEYAVNQINESGYLGDATLVINLQDAGSTPEGAIAAMTQLVDDGVVAVVGPTLSNQAVAADPVAADAGIPVLGVSNTASGLEDTIGEFYFRNSLPEVKVIPGVVVQASEILGLENVAVMYSDNDQFTVSGYEVFIQALEENGVNVVLEETFQTGDVDFNAQLTNIIAEEPDAIVVSALAAEIVPLLEQARSLGYTGPIIGGNGFNAPGIASEETGAGADANGVIVGGAWNAARQNALSEAFTTAFTEEFELNADQFSVQAYTGVWIIATAIRCADSSASADIKAALEDFPEIETPLGSFSFDEEGLPAHEPAAQIIIDGKYELLTEESAAQVFGE